MLSAIFAVAAVVVVVAGAVVHVVVVIVFVVAVVVVVVINIVIVAVDLLVFYQLMMTSRNSFVWGRHQDFLRKQKISTLLRNLALLLPSKN